MTELNFNYAIICWNKSQSFFLYLHSSSTFCTIIFFQIFRDRQCLTALRFPYHHVTQCRQSIIHITWQMFYDKAYCPDKTSYATYIDNKNFKKNEYICQSYIIQSKLHLKSHHLRPFSTSTGRAKLINGVTFFQWLKWGKVNKIQEETAFLCYFKEFRHSNIYILIIPF